MSRCRAAISFLIVLAVCAVALADDDDPEALVFQPVVVTGSRIPRPDFESASPIVTVTQEAFEQTGAPTVEAVLNRYPQFAPSFTGSSNNPSAGGQAQLDLRGLGTTSTLVLLDGRRLVPGGGAGVPDVNVIPPALIERVEIITGGASAVYGSDAIAGVVNFRLRESFEGYELGGFYGRTERGDGEQWDMRFTAGTDFAGGRGSAYGSIGHAERRLVTAGDRAFSRYFLNYVGPDDGTLGPGRAFVPAGDMVIEEGRAILPIAGANAIDAAAFHALFAAYGYPLGSVPLQSSFGFNQDRTLFAQGTLSPGSVANFRGVQDPVLFTDRGYGYNFLPHSALQLPLERDSVFGRLSFDILDSTRLYADVLYAAYDSFRQLAPTPVGNVRMPRNNPFISEDLAFLLDSRPSPDAAFVWSKRVSELGPRIARDRYRVSQATIGMDGYFAMGWSFDAYLQHGENRATLTQWGNALRSRIEELTFAPDGGLAACGGFDIFGLGSISAACADYIAVDATSETRTRQSLAEASIEGPLLELPAGDLRMAFGIFHKRDEFSYAADPIASVVLPDGRVDLVGFNASANVDGKERNTDLYTEALVPLLADRPGVFALEAGLGYRHAEYDAAGGADAWKLELMYRPIEALRIRGSFQNAVRAPSISELFSPQLPTFIGLTPIGGDPCAATSAARTGPDAAAVEALCLAQGLPPELLADFHPGFSFVPGFGGGNPELHRESADTWTVGLAWSPARDHPRLGRLQASIDAYRIELDDTIAGVSADRVIALCFNPAVNPDFSVDQHWCGFFSRDPASGEILDAYSILHNIGSWKTSGIDAQLDWQLQFGPGIFGLNWLVTRLGSFEIDFGADAPKEKVRGVTHPAVGSSAPKWKSVLGLNYAWRRVGLNARVRYIHPMREYFAPEFRVPSRTYADLHASYDFGSGVLDGLRLGYGIENLTDRAPPIIPNRAVNTDPQQYDVLGRRYFATLNYRF